MDERGVGRIFNAKGEEVLSDVRYEIAETPDTTEVRSLRGRSHVSGFGTLDGRILSPAFPFALEGEPIELELEDGRRWSCFYANGRLVNSGGLK